MDSRSRDLGSRSNECAALLSIALVQYDSNEVELAIEANREALAIARENKDRAREARAHDELSIGHHRLGQIATAVNYGKEALRIFTETESPRAVIVCERLTAWERSLEVQGGPA